MALSSEAAVPVSEIYQLGDLRVDAGQRRVTRGDLDLALPKLSFTLLLELVRAAPNVLTIEALMARVWPGVVVSHETVNKRANLLREALGDDPRAPRYVAGVRGHGYRIMPPVHRIEDAGPLSIPPAAKPAPPPRLTPLPVRKSAHLRTLGLLIGACVIAAVVTALLLQWRADESTAPTAVGVPERTVAVLPFTNLSPEASDAYLAQALPEMILNRLARIDGLAVIARSSSFALARERLSVQEIGQRLHCGYLLNGSIQRDALEVRFVVQLVETATGAVIWSTHSDRQLQSLFAVEDEIAEQVAGALSARLAGLEPAGAPAARTGNVEAYLAYLRGRALLGRLSVAESQAAIPYFEKAAKLDPHFAPAFAALYDAHMQSAAKRWEALGPLRARYNKLIERALAIDRESGAAYFARAMWGEDDPVSREEDFRRGMALDPSNGRGLIAYAEFLSNVVGRRGDAQAILQRALWIDPMSPHARFRVAMDSLDSGGAAEIEQRTLDILRQDPDFVPALQRQAKYRWLHGELAQSISYIERAIALDPLNPWLRNTAMAIYLDLGDVAAAQDVAAGTSQSAAAARLLLAQHAGDWRAAGRLALDHGTWNHSEFETWEAGEALRDYGLLTRDPAPAIAALKRRYGLTEPRSSALSLLSFRHAAYVADLLDSAGDSEQAERWRRASAEWNDANEAKYGSVVARRLRAGLQLRAGRKDEALRELDASFRSGDYVHWWYPIERDPLWAPLRADPQFAAIAANVRAYVAGQASQLDALRRQGAVPPRPAPRARDTRP